ncbi:MAG: CotH kinase family protein [Bacteroidales bacterium]|nr:CotH kinase family protein [Bacteroidales bacterium]
MRRTGMFAMGLLVVALGFADDAKLSGTIIGTELSGDAAGNATTTENTKEMAFDGDFNTYFKAYISDDEWDYNRTWVGLDLGEPHVITRIGFASRKMRSYKMQLAVVEGANEPDFSDAMPIYMIRDDKTPSGHMTYADINVSRGFRYVRFMSGPSAACNFAEIEFYGHPGEGDDSQLFQLTNLPLVVVNTEGMCMMQSKDDKVNSTVHIISDGGTSLLSKKDTECKGRGNASWNFPKKPMRLKFPKKQTVLPDAPAKCKKWTLINNYGDKSLMRNKIAFHMSRGIGLSYTPYCQFVDLIFNGEYQGCYQLCDQVEVNPGRVEITEMTPDDIEGEALTGGYFIEIDAYANQEASWFESLRGIPVTIKSPDDDEITPEQSAYIKDYFNKFETAVFTYGFTSETTGYRKYLNLDSFLQYFIVGELDGNTDYFWSIYMSKERGEEKFVVGPVWDVDLGFDNDYRTYPIANKTEFIYRSGGSVASSAVKRLVDRILVSDTKARERLKYLWSDARVNRHYNPTYYCKLVDRYAEQLAQSQELNFKRWNILGESVHMNPAVSGSYEGEVQRVKDYLNERFAQLDRIIGTVEVEVTNPDIDQEELEDDGTGAVEQVKTANRCRVAVDGACVRFIDTEGDYAIYTMSGTIADRGNCSRVLSRPLESGIYIVVTPGGTAKLIVK